MNGLDFLKEYQRNSECYLPMIDHAGKVFPRRDPKFEEYNVGWNSGLVGSNRPYFAECWRTDGITILTVFISRIGIEDRSIGEIDAMLEEAQLYHILPGARRPAVVIFSDDSGNEFYSLNVIVGDENCTYIDHSLAILPFSMLNEYNKDKVNEAQG